MQLVHRTLDAVEHVIERQSEMAHFVVSFSRWDPGIQAGMADARRNLANFAYMAQHAPSGKEDNAEAEENKQQPKQKESQAKASQHPQFVPFRKPKIDITSIIDTDGSNAKGDLKALDVEICWLAGNHPDCKNGRFPRQPTA